MMLTTLGIAFFRLGHCRPLVVLVTEPSALALSAVGAVVVDGHKGTH